MADEIRLDGMAFKIARSERDAPLLNVTRRQSERGDPSSLHMAEWHVDGPDLTSFEQILFGNQSGYLGRDYGEGTDGRFEGVDTLGPLISTVTLSTHDVAYSGLKFGTATANLGSTFRFGNAPAATQAEGCAQFGPYLYVIRQNHLAKVQISDMALKFTGRTLPDPATSIVRTTSQNDVNADEVSVGMQSAAYQVLTAAGEGVNPDTWQENADDEKVRIFGVAPDRIVGFHEQTVKGNILTGTNTMRDGNWQTVATIRNKTVVFTGFALDGNLWVLGTSNGPYMLDAQTAEFFPVIDEIDNDDENCKQMGTWFPIGVVIPLRSALRQQKNRRGEGFGVEKFDWNTSPVQGQPTAQAGSTRWLYTTQRNDAGSKTHLVAWGDWHPGDPTRQQHLLAPHVIADLGDNQSRFLKYIGTANGIRTNETLVGGLGANIFHMTVGRTAPREIDDSNYTYAASGTTHLTECRRFPHLLKDVEYVEFESNDCTTTRTLTTAIAFDGKTAVALSGKLKDETGATVNGVVQTDGVQRIRALYDDASPRLDMSGYRFKPQNAFARPSATTTTSPQIVGTYRVHYRVRGEMTRQFDGALDLADDARATRKEREAKLLDLQNDMPFKIEHEGEVYWAAMDELRITPTGSNTSRAQFQYTEWTTPYADRP